MKTTFRLEITPAVPEALARLPELAGNLYFSWHRPTRALFEELDPALWGQVRGNPKQLLRTVDQAALDRAAASPQFIARYREVLATFDAYLNAPPLADSPLVAYFCAEYGFTQSFPVYSGGLGVLAGDHCKAASDERLNFVAVGLLYQQGYFNQRVDADGIQHAEYHDLETTDLPIEPLHAADGRWLSVQVRIQDRIVHARLWRARVGRISLVLLDTNYELNAQGDRAITYRLYGGDESTRVCQEMILGIGGVRALRALGLQPAVWHMNEGHAAFLVVELMREKLLGGLDAATALEAVAAQCAFTTHTPVAAGHDHFGHDLLLSHFAGELAHLGLSAEAFFALGRTAAAPGSFNMTRLAIAGARHVNGVSRIHGEVSSQLLADAWPEVRPGENPVGYVTNGVHVPTFLHQKWAEFFDEVVGPDWREKISDTAFWRSLERVPDRAWWQTAQLVKSDMLACVRERLRREFARKGQSPAQWRHVARLLDPARPDVLVVGFARRFATYKRASLLLRDRARLARIVEQSGRPVVFLFAGKAHPADQPGQQVLREIKQLMMQPEFMGKVIFLDDYDMQLARWLVSGCDVWLNNPIAPLEASGTSGMKAAANGRLNLSVLDGWWAEGFEGDNGWGIPPIISQDPARRDALEAELIVDALEEEVVPMYYARGEAGVPLEWVRRCKRAMMSVIPRFNMRRVVMDYSRGIYLPAAQQGARLSRDDHAGARALVEWKRRVRAEWPRVTLRALSTPQRGLARTESLCIRVAVQLGGLDASDVTVELVAQRTLPEPPAESPGPSSYRQPPPAARWVVRLAPTGEREPDGATVFAVDAPPPGSGQYVGELRCWPRHELLSHPHEMGLMRWLEM